MQDLNHITGAIIGASFRITQKLGPGLLESVYETVLARDLARAGFHVERQKLISFDFEGLWFENALKIDLLVDRAVAVEIKSARAITPVQKTTTDILAPYRFAPGPSSELRSRNLEKRNCENRE